jgi:hypothetical protein
VDFDISIMNWFADFVVIAFIIINRGLAIVEYRSRYVAAREGLLIVIALSIHPICVMDE